MSQERKAISLLQVALGASLLAAAAVGVAAFVPKSRLAPLAEPVRDALEWPVWGAIALWAVSLFHADPKAPAFDDLRPFDEF